MTVENRFRPAQLDNAERTVTEAGGRLVEVFYRDDGRISDTSTGNGSSANSIDL
jgi:hypothetical protein